jgi:DNA-binding Lrp family transcriptional regulator
MTEIDAVDKRILNHLLDNGRDSYREIAKKMKLSPATVMKRVRALESKGVIKNYTAVLDYDKLGYEIHIIIDVRVARGKLHLVEKKIAKHQNVSAVYDNTGSFDSTVIARFRTRATMDNFLKNLQTFDFVERTETKLILSTIKKKNINLG